MQLTQNLAADKCTIGYNPVEQKMLAHLCAEVKSFYADPKNQQAYEAWKNKEENNDHHDYP